MQHTKQEILLPPMVSWQQRHDMSRDRKNRGSIGADWGGQVQVGWLLVVPVCTSFYILFHWDSISFVSLEVYQKNDFPMSK